MEVFRSPTLARLRAPDGFKYEEPEWLDGFFVLTWGTEDMTVVQISENSVFVNGKEFAYAETESSQEFINYFIPYLMLN